MKTRRVVALQSEDRGESAAVKQVEITITAQQGALLNRVDADLQSARQQQNMVVAAILAGHGIVSALVTGRGGTPESPTLILQVSE